MGIRITLQMSRQAIGDGCLFLSCCRALLADWGIDNQCHWHWNILLFLASGHENVNIYSSSCPPIWFCSGHTCGVLSDPTLACAAHYVFTWTAPSPSRHTEHLNVLWWDKREKVTVRGIFYNVNKSHQGQILCRYFLPHVGTERQVLNVMLGSGGYWPGVAQESS